MQAKITKRAIDALAAGEKDVIVWDTELPGFGVRARKAGGKFYVLKYRSAGKQRWHGIGRHGAPWTPELARKEARRILGEVAAGRDPANERAEAVKKAKASTTIADAIDEFAEAHCRHLRSGNQVAYLLRKHVSGRWGARAVASIEHRDIVALLREVQGNDRTKRAYIANRVRAALSRFFAWAISEALVPARENPVTGTEPRRGEVKRECVLTETGIKVVWNASTNWPFGAIVRLLLATGQRRDEVGGMRWSELDFQRRMWCLPKERTKAARDHLVPLNDVAIEILKACPRIEGCDSVFSTRMMRSHEGKWAVFCGWSQAKRRLDAKIGRGSNLETLARDAEGAVQNWRLHDLRRTVATQMQAAGVPPHTIAAVLNHSTAGLFGVTAIYMRDKQEEAKRAALKAWGRRLRTIIAPSEKAGAILLSGAGG
jgi:integrase